jgi:hypothetical protein
MPPRDDGVNGETDAFTAFPFVVARNKTLDWRPLLAPAPLVGSAEEYALVLETGSSRHPTPVTACRWRDHTSTPWLLAYRSIPAAPGLVGEEGTEQLSDRFGRGLFLVEGVALRGVHEARPELVAELIERVHPQAVAAFREFWSADDERVAVQATQPLDVGTVGPMRGPADDEPDPVRRSAAEPDDPG